MTVKVEIRVGRKKYKLYDYEAAQLFNKLRNYFASVGAFDDDGSLSARKIGFEGEEK